MNPVVGHGVVRPDALRDTSVGPRWERRTALLAQALVVLAGFDHQIFVGISLPLLAAVVLIPVWWPVIRGYQLTVWLVSMSLAALVWGAVLAFNTSIDHLVDEKVAQSFVGVILTGVATVAFVLWARRLVPLHRVVLLYGLGLMAKTVVFGGTTWKFDLAVPVTLIVLGLVGGWRNRLLSAAAILLLGGVGVLNDSRSYFAFCFLAALLTLWQVLMARPAGTRSGDRLRRWTPVLLLASVAVVLYLGLSALLTSGVLGAELQQRSVDQVQTSGSLISGGRPEWAATRELIRLRPGGYGLGVVPTWTDVEAGRAGMTAIGVDAGGYVENYMFAGSIELHSGMSDLWANCGIVGVALGVLIIFVLVRNISTLLATRSAETVVIFFCSVALWSMLFGPVFTDWRMISLALGLSMLSKDGTAEHEAATP